MFPADSHELEHLRDHMCRSVVKPPLLVFVDEMKVCERSGMIIEHKSHSRHNTVLKYSVSDSECGDFVLFRSD